MTNEFTREPRLADGIGRALTEVREASGIASQVEFAAITGLTRPRISRVEGGRARPRPDEVEKWAQAANLDEAGSRRLLDMLAEYDEWRADLDARIRYGVAGDEIGYTETFKATKEIRTFAATELPSYLQLDGYARAVIQTSRPSAPEDECSEALKARLERAGFLGDANKHFKVVLAESALRWLPCDPDAMRSQLGHLFQFLNSERVELWILPMGRRLNTIPRQGFTVHDKRLVVVELYGGFATFRQKEPQKYCDVHQDLLTSAVRGDAARELLTAAMAAVPAR
jgi:transcriptional regulator with XRE-family HTH domain